MLSIWTSLKICRFGKDFKAVLADGEDQDQTARFVKSDLDLRCLQ